MHFTILLKTNVTLIFRFELCNGLLPALISQPLSSTFTQYIVMFVCVWPIKLLQFEIKITATTCVIHLQTLFCVILKHFPLEYNIKYVKQNLTFFAPLPLHNVKLWHHIYHLLTTLIPYERYLSIRLFKTSTNLINLKLKLIVTLYCCCSTRFNTCGKWCVETARRG